MYVYSCVFDSFDFIVLCMFYLLPGVWEDETVIIIRSLFLQHIHFIGLTCLICIISTCTLNNSFFSCSYFCITMVCFLYMTYPLLLSVSFQCAWWKLLRGCCGHHPFYVRVHKSWANLGWINDSVTTVLRLIIWIALLGLGKLFSQNLVQAFGQKVSEAQPADMVSIITHLICVCFCPHRSGEVSVSHIFEHKWSVNVAV